jgi:hypothetical protein
MTDLQLYRQINSLPPSLQEEVKDFIEFLKARKNDKKEREFGCAQGLFFMHPDFDELLDDFKEYM